MRGLHGSQGVNNKLEQIHYTQLQKKNAYQLIYITESEENSNAQQHFSKSRPEVLQGHESVTHCLT